MGENFDGESFREIFESIKDPRIERTRLHPLSSVLFLCLCAVISGADTTVAIERFGHAKEEMLATLMPFPNGIPSHDTICRILAKINPFELERLFSSGMKAVAQLSKGTLIAIDGKTLRRAWDKKGGGEMVHMVSAFASANRLVLGQVRTDTKSNEISAIPHLLDLIALKGCLVTIDAIGCQVAIAEKITQAGADYFLAVKENQPELAAALRSSFDARDEEPKAQKSKDTDESSESRHGREDVRRCTVIHGPN
jgi:predicted transposase YbfD/YdcC